MTARSTFSIMSLLRDGRLRVPAVRVQVDAQADFAALYFVAIGEHGGGGQLDLVEAGSVHGVQVFDPPLPVMKAEPGVARRDGFVFEAQRAGGVAPKHDLGLGVSAIERIPGTV